MLNGIQIVLQVSNINFPTLCLLPFLLCSSLFSLIALVDDLIDISF